MTILAGCLKLVYKHHRLRKHTAYAAKTKYEQQQTQVTSITRRGRKQDIPFGVRAIESGIEVEGVWISRSNTPSGSRQASPQSSVAGESALAKDCGSSELLPIHDTSLLAVSAPPHPNSDPIAVSGSNSNPYLEQPTSSDAPPDSASAFATDAMNVRNRPTYRPRQSSHLRFSSADVLGNDVFENGAREQRLKIARQSGGNMAYTYRLLNECNEKCCRRRARYRPNLRIIIRPRGYFAALYTVTT